MYNVPANFINEQQIRNILEANKKADFGQIKQVLSKAREMKGLSLEDVAVLTSISDPEMLAELFNTANEVKETIYGKRLVLFAPLYISNMCSNECLYCAFRATNKEIVRSALSQEQIARETECADQARTQTYFNGGRGIISQSGISVYFGFNTNHLQSKISARRNSPCKRKYCTS